MRRIVSKAEEKKKENRNKILVSVLLLSIMVLSVFGIVADSLWKSEEDSGRVKYNGIDFINYNERWFFETKGIEFVIFNSPEELNEIIIENVSPVEDYFGKPLYIYSKDKSFESQIYYNFNRFSERIRAGCFEDLECQGDFPTKTCEDRFILITESEEKSILQERGCVFISSPKEETQKVLDTFFLKVTGVN